MNKDQVKGSARAVAGKVQKNAGKTVGSTEQRLKGTARELGGKAQKAFGDVKEDVRKEAKREEKEDARRQRAN